MRETGNKDLSPCEYIVELATQISDKIDVELFKPSILPLLVLLGVNVSVGIALKLFL